MSSDTFEIALRVTGGSDYSVFEIDADTDLHELECLICDMLERHFSLVSAPDDKEV